MAIVDTSTVIDIGKNVRHAITAVKKLGETGEELFASTITIFELSTGKPPGLSENRKLLLSSMRILPFTAEHAEKAGILFRQLASEGQEINPADCMIAATALCEKQAIITSNPKHFERITGLEVITY